MNEKNKIRLKISSILDIPINNYIKDFTFIVNGEEIQTSRLVSDLLSSKISRIHLIDPTFDRIIINTTKPGNFHNIIKLQEFTERPIDPNEIIFYDEIIEQLGIDHFEIIEFEDQNLLDTNDEKSFFSYISNHFQKGRIISQKKQLKAIESN